ncbi:Biopolymer transport protein [Snodgrassella alvi SCGC AB-598-O11]|nr:Biopolymer transport protein [Snodgrassella alvi SCGC AB-598-O11]
MAFGHFSDDEVHESADINVTPLVDVMLVLLIVFMITMPVLTHSIPLTLPTTANPAEQTEPKSPLRLSIGADGQYKLGEQTLSLTQLQKHSDWVKNAAHIRHLHEMNQKIKALEHQLAELNGNSSNQQD